MPTSSLSESAVFPRSVTFSLCLDAAIFLLLAAPFSFQLWLPDQGRCTSSADSLAQDQVSVCIPLSEPVETF